MRALWILALGFLTAVAFATPQPIMGPITSGGSGGPNPFSDKLIGSIGTLGSGGGGVSNDLLLVGGVSYLLLADGVSKLCLASGC